MTKVVRRTRTKRIWHTKTQTRRARNKKIKSREHKTRKRTRTVRTRNRKIENDEDCKNRTWRIRRRGPGNQSQQDKRLEDQDKEDQWHHN